MFVSGEKQKLLTCKVERTKDQSGIKTENRRADRATLAFLQFFICSDPYTMNEEELKGELGKLEKKIVDPIDL